MSALRSVVKHSYLTGKDKGVGRAQAHLRYIQFRGGKDKDEEPRSFFSGLRDDITGREVAAAVNDQNPRSTVMHKLILSPGVQGADVKEYCREVMADLGSRKGLDLEWYAVLHENTDHPHVHIVVMGKDAYGHKVRLSKVDYTRVKEAGDRYLERNRLLDREEKVKEKDKDPDREKRNPVSKFVDALRAAALGFAREMERDAGGEKKPQTKFQQRKREKEEERQQEVSALGEGIDLTAYLAKQAKIEEREETRKQKAWKEYCKPIEIDRGANEPIIYNRASSIESLRQLEKDYESEDPRVRAGMGEADSKRLNDWIIEKYRDEKRIDSKAQKLEKIDIELDTGAKAMWSQNSSLEELRKLEAMNARAEVYLEPAEQRALANWILEQELKEPVRIEIEPGSEPVLYDREDPKESLRFLTKEYEKGEPWAKENLSKEDYQKVKIWIRDRDRLEDEKDKDEPIRKLYWDEGAGDGETLVWDRNSSIEELRDLADYCKKNPDKEFTQKDMERIKGWLDEKEKDPDRSIKAGKTKDGDDRYVNRNLDADTLKAAREELTKSPDASKADVAMLDRWIDEREKTENRPGEDEKKQPRRRTRTALEKSMNRDVRLDRATRWDNYYKEKSEQRQHLEGQRENLKAQKRSLDKYEKERETVDGQYSEIWGADKSAIAAGPMGAASGGLRPLGANQFLRLLKGIGKNEERNRELAEKDEVKTQARLEGELTKDAKTWKAPEEKQPEKEAEKPEKKDEKPKENKAAPVVREPVAEKEPPAIDNSALQTETKELSKDVKNKKKKEEDRDKRPATDPDKGEREDPFKYDPWGRY